MKTRCIFIRENRSGSLKDTSLYIDIGAAYTVTAPKRTVINLNTIGIYLSYSGTEMQYALDVRSFFKAANLVSYFG